MKTADPKERVTVTLDASIVRRIDRVADARGDSRSAVVERILWNEIEGEEKFLGTMENPVTRMVLEALLSSPRLMESIAVLVGRKLETGVAEEVAAGVAKQAGRGRERRTAKKSGVRKGTGLAGA